jgi:hypothetical protein
MKAWLTKRVMTVQVIRHLQPKKMMPVETHYYILTSSAKVKSIKD